MVFPKWHCGRGRYKSMHGQLFLKRGYIPTEKVFFYPKNDIYRPQTFLEKEEQSAFFWPQRDNFLVLRGDRCVMGDFSGLNHMYGTNQPFSQYSTFLESTKINDRKTITFVGYILQTEINSAQARCCLAQKKLL